jgi:hypothetical protein
MSISEYRLVAGGWLILLVFLTVFWYGTLRRLSGILKERLDSTRSHQPIPQGLVALFLFLYRGDFKQTGDERLKAVCRRLRQLLYGYLGGIGAYIVFLVLFHPRY